MPTIELAGGPIKYARSGPREGRPVVFVHGYQMSASLWRPLSERMAERGFACVAPTWPLGAHREPMRQDADLAMEGIAAMVGELLDLLALEDVVLVGNETGGAIAQIVANHESAAAEVVGFDQLRRVRALPAGDPQAADRRRETGPGLHRGDPTAADPDWTQNRVRSAGACRHRPPGQGVDRAGAERSTDQTRSRRFTASMNRRSTVTAAAGLPQFTRPTLIAWSADDAFFPITDGQRLANALPDSRLEVIQRSRTFAMIDQPDRNTTSSPTWHPASSAPPTLMSPPDCALTSTTSSAA